VSLAGPAAGLLLGGAVLLAARAMPPFTVDEIQQLAGAPTSPKALALVAIQFSTWVNIYWSIFNLLPILPLDGGNVSREVLQGVTKGRGEVAARIVSIVVAIGVAIAAYVVWHGWWVPLLCALFSFSNFRAVREVYLSKRDESLVEPLESAVEALKDNDGARVVKIAGPIVERAASARMRAEAIHILAYGLLLQRKFEEADAVMRKLPSGFSANPQYAELRGQLAQ